VQDWSNHAEYNMANASMSQKRASRQNETSRAVHNDTVHDNLGMYTDVHQTMEHKVKTTYKLREKLQLRAAALEKAIAHTRGSLVELDMAHRAKDGPLQLCKWRMEQREKRPLREQVRDSVEVSLEAENATLIEAQRKLQEAIAKTNKLIAMLEDKLAELRYDIDLKTQALGIDEMCLRTTQRSYQVVLDHTPRSHSLGGSPRILSAARTSPQRHGKLQESTRNEMKRQQHAARLAQSGLNLDEAARILREANSKLIVRCEKAADKALAKTEHALQARINENRLLRRSLEREVRETHHKMHDTRRTISETRSQMKSLGEPMDNAATCSAWRKQRAHREEILDPVSARLQEHQTMLIRAHEDLRDHHDSEKQHYQQLHHAKDRLKADLDDKTKSLHIDLNCLTHSATHVNGKPISNLNKTRLSKAFAIDPMWVALEAMRSDHTDYGSYTVR